MYPTIQDDTQLSRHTNISGTLLHLQTDLPGCKEFSKLNLVISSLAHCQVSNIRSYHRSCHNHRKLFLRFMSFF